MLPLAAIFFAISITLLVLPTSSTDNQQNRYQTCSSTSFSCHGANISDIGYPFWGSGRPKYCGHPSLELLCLPADKGGDRVQLLIHQGENTTPFTVLNMKYDQLSITLELRGWDDITCTTFNNKYSEFFNLTTRDDNITLIYNCSKGLSMGNLHDPIPCLQFPTTYQAYYLQNMSAIKEDAACNSFGFPVFKKQLDLYNKGNVTDLTYVLNQGFEVIHEYSSDCIKCQESGGICGSSDDSHFICWFEKEKSGNLNLIGLESGIGGIFVFVLVLSFSLCCCLKPIFRSAATLSNKKFSIFWRSKAANCPNVDVFLQIYGSLALTRHTYANIKKMTSGFKDKLGEGGYAIVYKGKLPNDSLVAVKVLKQSKGDGEDFLNEVASISRTNHVNIVALLGFCFEGNKRALIYEYMPNGSLEKFTFHGANASNSTQSLPWETLLNIALGIARGLDYLHRGCNARILHLDIKPHNILLNEEFCPKISDFGLARLCPLRESTISMMEARGTIGYIAPEVFCRTIGGVSHKSDVYSFGMMVLDMVCGRKDLLANRQRSSELCFPQWIYERLEVVDDESSFEGTRNNEEKVIQKKMILVSLWCIQTYPLDRPSMSGVVDMLQGGVESIGMPPKRNLSSPPSLAFNAPST